MGQEAWLRAYLDKIDNKSTLCPQCGNGPVEWKLVGDPSTRMGYAILWCAQCERGGHLSRVRIPDGVAFVSIFDAEARSEGVPNVQFED